MKPKTARTILVRRGLRARIAREVREEKVLCTAARNRSGGRAQRAATESGTHTQEDGALLARWDAALRARGVCLHSRKMRRLSQEVLEEPLLLKSGAAGCCVATRRCMHNCDTRTSATSLFSFSRPTEPIDKMQCGVMMGSGDKCTRDKGAFLRLPRARQAARPCMRPSPAQLPRAPRPRRRPPPPPPRPAGRHVHVPLFRAQAQVRRGHEDWSARGAAPRALATTTLLRPLPPPRAPAALPSLRRALQENNQPGQDVPDSRQQRVGRCRAGAARRGASVLRTQGTERAGRLEQERLRRNQGQAACGMFEIRAR